jgi:hypothetical protein
MMQNDPRVVRDKSLYSRRETDRHGIKIPEKADILGVKPRAIGRDGKAHQFFGIDRGERGKMSELISTTPPKKSC